MGTRAQMATGFFHEGMDGFRFHQVRHLLADKLSRAGGLVVECVPPPTVKPDQPNS